MSVQDPGSARPGRLLGLILMGIAVIAVVLGVITLIDGNSGNNGSGGGGGTTTRPPATSGTSTPGSSQPGTKPPTTQPTQPSGQPTQTSTNTPPPAPPPANPRDQPVRVLNNGTIRGLAAQAARDFRADGWNVVEVGNFPDAILPTTTAFFRPGTGEEAAAQELARKFNMRAEPRIPALANRPPGVIVIVTNDYGGK